MEQTRQPDTEQDRSCLEVLNEVVGNEPGIVNVSLDTDQKQMSFDYDPAKISETDVAQVAQRLVPTLEQRWHTCTLRLGRHGGRACESCAFALEKRLHELPGVRRASASYMGGVLSVDYDDVLISADEIARQVKQLGVQVAPSASELPSEIPDLAELGERPKSWLDRARTWLTEDRLELIFTILTLTTMIAGLVAERAAAPVTVAVLYATAYVTGGTFGLKAGIESLRDHTIDVDLLMVLAAVGAAVVGEPFEGVMLLFLFSLSNVLQNYALDRTRNAIRSLMKLRPNQALVRRGDETVTVPIDQIKVDDRMIVKPGERIALDGVVVAGASAVDQASITGESLPVDKEVGDTVFAGTINQSGNLEVAVSRLAQDSTIARLIKMVEEAQSEKAGTQRFIDTAEQYYAMAVIVFTGLAIVIPQLFWQEAFDTAFYRAMTIMVAASPCALVISTPATVLSAIGNGARRGVLFKGGIHVENASTVKVVTFDKTGTLTAGEAKVTGVKVIDGESDWGGNEDALLRLAAAVEAKSEHPLAQATVTTAAEHQLKVPEATGFQSVAGQGVQATVEGIDLRIGNLRYFARHDCLHLEQAAQVVTRLQNEGKTSVLVAQITDSGQARILGIIAYADVLREDAARVVSALKQQGVEHVVMLTGDNEVVAQHIAAQVGVDEVYAELLPQDKVRVVREVQEKFGPVAMVGDGVNDAPALATASIGIAMGAAGTDVALETADIVLMSDDLQRIPYVLGLSRQTRKTLAVNLGFALFMILLMLATIFAASLPLPTAVIGHEGGTVLVSLNGLRMLAYNPK